MRVKPQLKGLKAYQPGKTIESVKREFGLEEVIKLASNENPYGASPLVKQAIEESLHELAIYPDGYATELREAVAHFLQVDPDELIFGAGSDEVIQIISRTLLEKGDNIITAWPTFSQYRHNATIEGVEVREIPLKDGVHDLDAMASAVDEQTKLLFICNPNNPSGTYVSESEIRRLLKRVPSDVLVILDEAYAEYVVAKDYPKSIQLVKEYKNVIVLRTFSKAYGLAALRVGYGVGDKSLVSVLNAVREPFNNTRLSQKAAAVAIKDQAFIEECRKKNRKGMERFYQFCDELGLNYYPSQGNFILIDFNRPGNDVFNYLLSKGVIVRSGEALGFKTCVRITIGDDRQNEKIIQILTDWLKDE